MYLKNTTEKDITLTMDSVPYKFPGNVKPPVVPPELDKHGNERPAPPPPTVKVVEVGDVQIGRYLINRTMQPVKRHSFGHHPGAVYSIVEYLPAKGEKIEVAAVYFKAPKPVPEPAESHSIHSFTQRKEGEPGPKPLQEDVDRDRKHRIATLSFDVLKRELIKRGLAKSNDRLTKPQVVDMIFATDWDPQRID